MSHPDIVFNSIPRCGNTFLAFSFTEALKENLGESISDFYKTRNIYPHNHFPFLLRLDEKSANIKQFTIFRNPFEQIPSLFALPYYRSVWKFPGVRNKDTLEKQILFAINDMKTWLSLQIENNNSHIILFEDIKNDINDVLKYIFDLIELPYIKKIDPEKVKEDVKNYEDEMYKDASEKLNMGRLPRGFNQTEQYKKIQSYLIDENWEYYNNYLEIINLYNEILKIKMGESFKSAHP